MHFIKPENSLIVWSLKHAFVVLILCNLTGSIACQTKEKDVDSILQKCQQSLDKDNLAGASACYQKAIVSNPKNAAQISKAGGDAVFKKCLAFKEKKDFKNSIICFEGLTELIPDSANVHFLLADSYYEYDRDKNHRDFDLLNRAEEALKRGLEINPKDAPAHSLYGEILKEKGDLRGAIAEHRKAVEIEPETGVFWAKLGLVQEKVNDIKGAIESYNKALKFKPDDTLMLYFLGNLYEKIGDKDKAIEMLNKLFEINPDYDKEAKEKLKTLKQQRETKQQNQKLEKFKTKAAGSY